MRANRRVFVEFSAELTGYAATDLEGTGLVDEYQALVERQIGPVIGALFLRTARRVLRPKGAKARDHAMRVEVLASPILGPLANAIITLWYLGSWSSLPASWYALAHVKPPRGVTPGARPMVPSARAYTQQLAFRAAGAHPPGANPTGFGGWAIPPVFGDFEESR